MRRKQDKALVLMLAGSFVINACLSLYALRGLHQFSILIQAIQRALSDPPQQRSFGG